MITDSQGHQLSGATTEAAAQYGLAVEAFNTYRGDPIALLSNAIEIAPGFAMAHLLKAHLLALATEPEATKQAKSTLSTVKSLRMNEREASHVVALEELLEGEWTAAAQLTDTHNMRFPRDIVALQAGHLMDFYRACGRNLRDRIARVLSSWSPDVPGYSIVLGLYAFGLEEMGEYAHAEDVGRCAVEMQPLDCWAHHAVAHVMEMQGRAEDGIGWMIAREPYWSGDANFFKVHNWWHRTLYHLDLGQIGEVLALYDDQIRKSRSAVVLDLVDASALLWRLSLADQNVGDRWSELAETWDAHADGRSYPFNDWHAVMAYLGSGREKEIERIIAALHQPQFKTGEVSAWRRQIGLPLIDGFAAFWHGDYKTTVERLLGARFIANAFGGSHAQRDIIDLTLTEAALRGGLHDVASALASERIRLKPHSPINRRFVLRTKTDAVSAKSAA